MSELSNPEFWVGVGFCCVVTFLIFAARKKVKSWAVGQSEIVKTELKEAHNLRIEAEALYQKYEQHTKNLDVEKAAIMQEAEKEVVALQKEADDRLSKKIERKKQDVQDRINLIQENTRKDLTNVMMEQVMDKTKDLLGKKQIKQSSSDMDKSLEDALKQLEKALAES
ncbi:MAG: hypothetical protein IJY92_02190 [Alphaproteobacteria bacterium]|nr:hypothetical protein [Alphaproteobacteria bacterium]